MRVLYDVTPLGNGAEPGPGRTGIFRAVQGFVDEMVRRDGVDSRFVALSTWYGEVQLARYVAGVGGPLGNRTVTAWDHGTVSHARAAAIVDRAAAAGADSPVGRRALTELAFFDRGARPLPVAGDFDVYHSFRGGLVDRARVRARTRVLMIHDLIPLLFPELFDRDHDRALQEILATIGADDLVVANSGCTRDDVCGRLGLDPERVIAIPLAADPAIFHRVTDRDALTEVRDRHGLGDAPYLLSVATLEPRKNIAALLDAFFALAGAGRSQGLRLVLVGAPGWRTEGLEERIAAHPRGTDLVTLTGYVADEDLAPLYSGASAFVYPSRYEGFGLPVLEAMCCATPVVISRARALTELTHGCAIEVDPDDVDSFADALLHASGDRTLGERGARRAAAFSWRRTVDLTLELYESALARRG